MSNSIELCLIRKCWHLLSGSSLGSIVFSEDNGEFAGLDYDNIDMFPLSPEMVINSPEVAICASSSMDVESCKYQWFKCVFYLCFTKSTMLQCIYHNIDYKTSCILSFFTASYLQSLQLSPISQGDASFLKQLFQSADESIRYSTPLKTIDDNQLNGM